MFAYRSIRRGSQVDLLEDMELAVRSFRRGARSPTTPCELTVSVNGTERLQLSEPAGPMAPASAIVDLRIQPRHEAVLIGALQWCPWRAAEMPIIPYPEPSSGGQSIRYLICTAAVWQVLEAIRAALDIPEGAALPEPVETLLDGSWAEG